MRLCAACGSVSIQGRQRKSVRSVSDDSWSMSSLVQADGRTLPRTRTASIAVSALGAVKRSSWRPSGDTGTTEGHPKVGLPDSTSFDGCRDTPPEGRTRCLTRHTISAIRWPPAPSTRSIDATTTTEVKRPVILTSSRSSTLVDEPSRSATTVARTQASSPSATPTGWLPPTAKKRPSTGTPPSPHRWREPTSLSRSATAGASRPSPCVSPPPAERCVG